MDCVVYIDGACSGNPGPAGIGVVIKHDEKVIEEVSEFIGPATNNIAEYSALIRALQESLKLKAETLKIFTDSELLARQVTGQYKIKNEKLRDLYQEAAVLARRFKSVSIQHVLREKNKDADALARKAVKDKKQTKVVAPAFQYAGEESPSSEG